MNWGGGREVRQTEEGWMAGLVDSRGSAGDGDRDEVLTKWPSDWKNEVVDEIEDEWVEVFQPLR